MTEVEFSKLKLLRAIYPDIDPMQLEKYFCSACQNFECSNNIDNIIAKRKTEESITFVIYLGSGTNRIVKIYKCFNGEKI